MDKCSMERLISANYVRYVNLGPLLQAAFHGDNDIKTCVLYIDMSSVCNTLFSSNAMIENYTVLTSGIINMVAHYKSFLRSLGLNVLSLIVYSENLANLNTMFVKDYNVKSEIHRKDAHIMDMIANNNNMLSILCKYLPDVAFIPRTFETSTVIYDLMSKYDLNNEFAHIIVSRDFYTWQLVGHKPNTIVIRPKKVNGEDQSFFVSQENVMDLFYSLRGSKKYNNIPPQLLSCILGATKMEERNIKAMESLNKVLSGISGLIESKAIIPQYNSDVMYIYNLLANMGLKVSPIIAEGRFKAIDVIYQQLVYMQTPECDYSNEIINLNDPESVQAVNNKYFRDNPLDLNKI